jgi:hypothetical protein
MNQQIAPKKRFYQRRWWIFTTLSLLLIFLLIRGYYSLTDDFRLSNITYAIPYHPEWNVAPLPPQEQTHLDSILAKKFSYLGKGSQSYVFVSEDDKYVLKFFKFKHLKPSLLITMIPKIAPLSSLQEKEIQRKNKKLLHLFQGYKLAFERDRLESGLIWIQLNPSHTPKVIAVLDKIGREHAIDLGSVVFIVQEKGETLRSVLTRQLTQGDLQQAKATLHQVLALYLHEYQKGIYDRDHGVMINMGFVGTRPLHLDVGKLTQDEEIKKPEVYQVDLAKVANKIAGWILHHYPAAYPELSQAMQTELSEIYGREFQFSNG